MTDPKQSKVADKVGFALAPDNGLGKRGNWLWAWSLAVPAGSQKVDAAEKFIAWATSKHYTDLVAAKEGWAQRSARNPHLALHEPGVREGGAVRQDDARTRSTRLTRLHPTVQAGSLLGVQFVAIPEFQGIATDVGQDFSAALAGTMSVDEALAKAQASTEAR